MVGEKRSHHDPVTADNKQAADEIERVVSRPSSIEEEMLLEAAELEEVEFGADAERADET